MNGYNIWEKAAKGCACRRLETTAVGELKHHLDLIPCYHQVEITGQFVRSSKPIIGLFILDPYIHYIFYREF